MLSLHVAYGTVIRDLYQWEYDMSNECQQKTDPNQPMIYQIKIKGHLRPHWTDKFGGLNITLEESGNSLLTGPVVDQAALHRLLRNVRDFGMTLLAVRAIEPDQADAPDVRS